MLAVLQLVVGNSPTPAAMDAYRYHPRSEQGMPSCAATQSIHDVSIISSISFSFLLVTAPLYPLSLHNSVISLHLRLLLCPIRRQKIRASTVGNCPYMPLQEGCHDRMKPGLVDSALDVTISATSLFTLLLLTSCLVNAIPWHGPRPTGSHEVGADWSPRPTSVPSNPLALFRRAGQYPLWVCGFIGGDLSESSVA